MIIEGTIKHYVKWIFLGTQRHPALWHMWESKTIEVEEAESRMLAISR